MMMRDRSSKLVMVTTKKVLNLSTFGQYMLHQNIKYSKSGLNRKTKFMS